MALAPYTPTNYINGQEPARSADNLNKTEQGLADASDAVIVLESQVADMGLLGSKILCGLKGGSGPATISSTWVDFTDYLTSIDVNMTGNVTTGEITVPYDGLYDLNVTVSIGFDDTGNSLGNVSIRIVGSDASSSLELASGLPKNQISAAFYPSIVLNLVGGVSYKLQIMSDDDLTNVVYHGIYFELEAKQITP